MYYEDYEAFDGCKVALLKGSLHDELDEYCNAHNFKVDVVEYESMQESEEALLNKDVVIGCLPPVSVIRGIPRL